MDCVSTPTVPAANAPAGDATGDVLQVRRGRVLFKARRPAALVLPLALVTETAGIVCLIVGATIGWFIVAAPVATLVVTALLFRPTLELTREGLLQRQYPFSSLTRWESMTAIAIVRAGNREILAYKLADGLPAPRRQPAAAMLRAAGSSYDGGFFADALAANNDQILATVESFLSAPERRATLPAARR